MKVFLKTSIKYIAVLSFMLGMLNVGIAQNKQDPSKRLLEAEQELYELIQVDKGSLTKAELKVWKKQKKHLKRIISEEKERDEFYTYRRNRNRFNNFNPYYGGYGFYSPRFYRYPRRVIVVRR